MSRVSQYLTQKELVSGFFVLLVAAILFSLSAHSAEASTGLSIQPVKVSLTMQPGQIATGTILLSNASDQDVEVEATLQDFIPVAGAEGMQFIERAPGVTSVRDWITLPNKHTFLFKRGEARQIEYVIATPLDAEPGSHFGVIFFKASDPAAAGSIKVGTQVGVPVLVTIPGDHLQKGNIISFTAPIFSTGAPIPFFLKFENVGTVYFEPKGEVTISNMLGQKVGVVPIEGQIVLPTGVKDLHFEWAGNGLLFGQYRANARVVDGTGQILTSKEIVFYVFPVWYVLYFFLGVLALYIVIKLLMRHVHISFR